MHKIVKKWSDADAEHYYELRVFVPYDNDHSCYACYDGWKGGRRKCSGNGPRWQHVTTGNLAWAKRTANHYNLGVPR